MNSRSSKPHFVRSTQKEKTSVKGCQGKIFCLMLSRITARNMLMNFQLILEYGRQKQKKINSLMKILNKNLQQRKFIMWKQFQALLLVKSKNQKILSNLSQISKRFKKQMLRGGWEKINYFVGKKEKKLAHRFFSSRQNALKNVMSHLVLGKIKESFITIKQNQGKRCSELKGRLLCKVEKSINKKLLAIGWNNLKFRQEKSIQNSNQFKQLQKKLKLVENQLSVKQKRCQELEDALERDQQVSKDKMRRATSHTNLKDVKNKRSSSEQKKSQNGNKDYSFMGSILNGSFLSFKSGPSSKPDSINGVECSCQYKQKYKYIKSQSQSLKNQLALIKKELQLTKDLNEHLQNQFTEYLGSGEHSEEIERLRREVKELKKEREYLRERMAKYQKYVTNLKYEFKLKMENLYRNIKKNQ